MQEIPPIPPNANEKPTRLPGGSFWLCEYKGAETVACIGNTGRHFFVAGDTAQIKISAGTFRHQLWPLNDESHSILIRIKRHGVWVSVDMFACTKSEIVAYFDEKGLSELKTWLWFLIGYAAGSRSRAQSLSTKTSSPGLLG